MAKCDKGLKGQQWNWIGYHIAAPNTSYKHDNQRLLYVKINGQLTRKDEVLPDTPGVILDLCPDDLMNEKDNITAFVGAHR